MADCIANIRKYTRMIEANLVDIEGNQRNAESGTSDCSSRQDAALSEEKRAFQPTGNPDGDWTEEYEAWLKMNIEAYETCKLKYECTDSILGAYKMSLRMFVSLKQRQRGC